MPYPVDGAWTDDNAATKQYDSYKVQAVVNWVNGYTHSGRAQGRHAGDLRDELPNRLDRREVEGSPAVLIGPNAQGDYTEGPSLPGGYVTVNGQQVPGPLLQSALDYVNGALQQMANAIQAGGEADSTAIVLTAKHGQSPQNSGQLQRIDDGPIIAGVNAAWAAQHPGSQTLVVQEADDDGLLCGCRTAHRLRPTSCRATCGATAPRPSTTPARPSPSSTRACSRSMPVINRRSSSASRPRSASPRRVRDLTGRHHLHDRLEDRRARWR